MEKKSDTKVWGNTETILGYEARLSANTHVCYLCECVLTPVCVIIQSSKAKLLFACELTGSSLAFHPIPSTFWASPFGHTRSSCLSSPEEVCSREVCSKG